MSPSFRDCMASLKDVLFEVTTVMYGTVKRADVAGQLVLRQFEAAVQHLDSKMRWQAKTPIAP